MHHNSIRHSDHHWGGYSLLSPHRIRPPDTFFIGAYPRYGVWLSFLCLLIFICPRVGSQFRQIINNYDLDITEKFLSHKTKFPRHLESFDLGFINPSAYNPLSVYYDVYPHNQSWIFITPCSTSNYTITVQSFHSDDTIRPQNKTKKRDKKEFDNWYEKVTVVNMKYTSGIGETMEIVNWKRQQINVTNIILGFMRLHIVKSDSLPAVYMIRQYSGKIDAFYPRIPPNSAVEICIKDDFKLNIHVSRAYNTNKYCVSLNLDETLPNFCTVQLRCKKSLLKQIRDYQDLHIRRPEIFNNYYLHRKIPKIENFVFLCSNVNSFDVNLDNRYQKSKIFINAFAVNSKTKFTDSYRPVEYRWGQFENRCQTHKKKKVKIYKLKSHLWIMGNETVLFNISIERNGLYPNKLFYQSCMHSQEQSLHVFQQESQTPLCVEIVHSRMTAFCTSLKPGMYRLQHTLNARPRSTVPVGQLYFLPENTYQYPHLQCNRTSDFSINLHKAALDDSKIFYKLNITFSRVPSLSDITYYFHIINFRIPNDSQFNQIEFMSHIEAKIKKERNFCKLNDKELGVERIVHNVTLSGLGCSDSIQREDYAVIPGLFNRNNTYAVLVYFTRSTDWRLNYVQFYSNRIFTMSSEEDVF